MSNDHMVCKDDNRCMNEIPKLLEVGATLRWLFASRHISLSH